MSKNKLDNVKKALTEIVRREQERVNKQQKLGKFPIEASVLIIAKEALVDLEGVIDRLKSEELVEEVADAVMRESCFPTICPPWDKVPMMRRRKEKAKAKAAINTITGEATDKVRGE